jgi:hypothetical protein
MKKLLLIAGIMLTVTGLALAEDFPKWEVFGGYSLLKTSLINTNNFMNYLQGPGYISLLSGSNPNYISGIEVSATRNLNPWLGIEGSFTGHFGTFEFDGSSGSTDSLDAINQTWSGKADYRRYTALFGPQFSFRKNSCVRPFAHALFGFSKMTAKNLSFSSIETEDYPEDNDHWTYARDFSGNIKGGANFAMALGGGLDVKAGKHASIRLVQLDYLPTYNDMEGSSRYTFKVTQNGVLDSTSQSTETFKIRAGRINNMKLSFGFVFKF